jgi:hypothetical protein
MILTVPRQALFQFAHYCSNIEDEKKRKARDRGVYLIATTCMIHQPDCSNALALKLPVEATASSSTMSDSGVVTIREVKPGPGPVVVV